MKNSTYPLTFVPLLFSAVFTLVISDTFANPAPMKPFIGEKAGNGGKVVRCPAPGGTLDEGDFSRERPAPHLEVLDYHRAKTEFGIVPLESVAGGDEFEQARALIERIRGINPTRATNYLADLEKFSSEASFVPDSDFPKSDDTSELAHCRGGQVIQVITQRKPLTTFEKRYLVNADLWAQLPTFQKALLLTHEIALKEALAVGYDVADGAARMNAILFARDLASFTTEQIGELMLATGLLYLKRPDECTNVMPYSAMILEILDTSRNSIQAELMIPYASLDFFRIKAPASTFPIFGDLAVFDADGPDDRDMQIDVAIETAHRVKGFLTFRFLSNMGHGRRAVSFDVLNDSREHL